MRTAYASDGREDFEIISRSKYPDILKQIYKIESSSGKNDGCKNKGLYNGFGYMQNSAMWKCFNSFEEVVSEVEGWLDRNYKESLGQTLCYYNTGKATEDCHYYTVKYLTW